MHVIGIDIGGTSIKLGVIDGSTGAVLQESSFPTPRSGARATAQEIAEHIEPLLKRYPEIVRLGVGVPGAMNADRSLVQYPPNLKGWGEEPLAKYLKEVLPQFERIEVDNDAKVATLAEARLGAGRNTSHFLLATLGTGVGGGLYVSEGGVFRGILRGASGGAGEFGHISIDHNGPQCGCGSRGCIEAYLGQRYLSSRTKEKLAANPTIVSALRDVREELTPRHIAEAMSAGDDFAREVFEEAGRLLGYAMATAANLLDIHVFIIGGGVAEAGDVLFDAVRSALRERTLKNIQPLIEVRKAQFGNKAGIIGAAMLVAED